VSVLAAGGARARTLFFNASRCAKPSACCLLLSSRLLLLLLLLLLLQFAARSLAAADSNVFIH
jgi:hypothetical protein